MGKRTLDGSTACTTLNVNIMAWTALVARQFERVPPVNPSGEDFHGPYNRLFPPDTSFTVVPQCLPNNTRSPADPIFMFEVLFEDKGRNTSLCNQNGVGKDFESPESG